jgi:hypothetical protein
MDVEQFNQLSSKMDTVIKLLAVNLVEGKGFKDQVSLLSAFGFQPKQIADILGKSPNNVRVMLHGIRKERGQLEAEEAQEEKEKPTEHAPEA